jgi:hypothetical protein
MVRIDHVKRYAYCLIVTVGQDPRVWRSIPGQHSGDQAERGGAQCLRDGELAGDDQNGPLATNLPDQ